MSITTEAPPQVGTITAEDLAALRSADSITFHLFRDTFYIRCHVRGDWGGTPRIWTVKEQHLFPTTDSIMSGDRERRIDVAGTCTGYGYGEDGDRQGAWSYSNSTTAFVSLSSAQYDDEWNTIKGLLKVGDVLTLIFRADAHSAPVHHAAGFHGDVCQLAIVRGNRKMTFRLDTRTSLDNTARMIRRFGI